MESAETSYSNATYGYRRIDPLLGVIYRFICDPRESYTTKLSEFPKSTNSIVFMRQPFLEPEFRTVTVSAELRSQSERINFIMTLASRYQTFLRFMDNFESSCLSSELVGTISLTVVLFHEGSNVSATESRIELTRSRHPGVEIRLEHIVKGAFSRSLGLQRGAELFAREALLFFIDVDISIRSDIIRRIRANTVRWQQVYYPIFFYHYDHRFFFNIIPVLESRKYPAGSAALNTSTFEDDVGYWRRYSYGMLAVYNEDLINVGGFDVSIEGKGLEDLRLLERFVAGNVTVFRAIDVGLAHEFHDLACDMPDKTQKRLCLRTRQTTLASTGVLATYVRARPAIYLRNKTSRSI